VSWEVISILVNGISALIKGARDGGAACLPAEDM
jgi:hypothetical protein